MNNNELNELLLENANEQDMYFRTYRNHDFTYSTDIIKIKINNKIIHYRVVVNLFGDHCYGSLDSIEKFRTTDFPCEDSRVSILLNGD